MKTGCSFPLHDLHDIRPRLVSSFFMFCFLWDFTGFSGRIFYFYFYFFLPAIGLHCGEGNGTLLQYSCLENPMNGGAWKAAMHGVAEDQTWLSDFTFNFHFHALEKEMFSSVLPWRIPGTGEPGGLPSMGSHWVRHDRSDLAAAAGLWPLLSFPNLLAYWVQHFYSIIFQDLK